MGEKCFLVLIKFLLLSQIIYGSVYKSSESHQTLSRLECKCKLWGKRGAWATQYGVTMCCSSQARASGSPAGTHNWELWPIQKTALMVSHNHYVFGCGPVRTRPRHRDGLVAVFLVVLWRSVQLDPRVLPADGLLAVIVLALLLRPLLQDSQHWFMSTRGLFSSSYTPTIKTHPGIHFTMM